MAVNEDLIPGVPCSQCMGGDPILYGCACGKEEAFLRYAMNGYYKEPFSPELRAALIHEADQDGEGSVDPKKLETASDQEVAQTAFWAMVAYARSQM